MESFVQYCRHREIEERRGLKFQRDLHVTNSFMTRLGLEADLEGHNGCVNCLEWNERGDLLASGSDDVQIMLWDPFHHRKLHTIQSGHHGNIFSVKFLPNNGDNIIVSGAADCKIRVHDVSAKETTYVCGCHAGRVKRIAVAPNVPNMFWSAAEDGTIMQFDLRVSHSCASNCSNILINLMNHLGKNAEAKCISINPRQPELIAVGANDPYIRVYDRRMISPTTVQMPKMSPLRLNLERQSFLAAMSDKDGDNLPTGCVQYYVAGHLPPKLGDYRKKYRTLASTYVTFSPDGSELLVNLGGEQIYLFDINKPQRLKTFDLQCFPPVASNGVCKDAFSATNGVSSHLNGTNGFTSTSNGVSVSLHRHSDSSPAEWVTYQKKWSELTPRAESLKMQANQAFEKQQYTIAINRYNDALQDSPSSAVLFGNRAAAYMKRGWDGDLYAALRDCHRALQLDMNHLKAHFRLARCLYELQWTREAGECLKLFKKRYPEHAQTSACEALDRDIKAAIYSKTTPEGDDSSNSSRGEGSSSQGNKKPKKQPLSEQEKIWRASAYDYQLRFCGHCNTTTDIKEANFFGSNGQFIVAGSDDGSFFVWNKKTTNIVRVLRGDDSIVNCLQPHPSSCLLATSGIDPVVRLWSPRPDDGSKDEREVEDSEDAAVANQKRMNADPLEVMLLNMGYRIRGVMDRDEDEEELEGPREPGPEVQCRPS